jgi:hypothetical protein
MPPRLPVHADRHRPPGRERVPAMGEPAVRVGLEDHPFGDAHDKADLLVGKVWLVEPASSPRGRSSPRPGRRSGRSGRRRDGRSAGLLLVPSEPSAQRGSGGRQLDARELVVTPEADEGPGFESPKAATSCATGATRRSGVTPPNSGKVGSYSSTASPPCSLSATRRFGHAAQAGALGPVPGATRPTRSGHAGHGGIGRSEGSATRRDQAPRRGCARR